MALIFFALAALFAVLGCVFLGLQRDTATQQAVTTNSAPTAASKAASDVPAPTRTAAAVAHAAPVADAKPVQTPAQPADSAPESAANEAAHSKPSPKEIGNAFEDFVVNFLADKRFTLLERTQDAVSSAGVYAESTKNPDLHVRQKYKGHSVDYYLECKYRSSWKDGKVTFPEWQLKRYRQFQRDRRRKVMIVLGVGGSPDAPKSFYIVPLDSVDGNAIHDGNAAFMVGRTSDALARYMSAYFDTVFSKK